MSNQSADAFRVWTAGIRKMLIEAGEKSAAARVDNYSFETFDAGWQASRRAALEECEKVCDEIANDCWSLYKGRAPYTGREPGRADPQVQGESDGADKCAAAIRALSGPTET